MLGNWISRIQDAWDTPFDKTTTIGAIIDKDTTQEAIESTYAIFVNSASHGFTYGRTGNCSPGVYMLCETVPSNVSGRWVYALNTSIKNVSVSNELSTTYSMTVSYHDGNQSGETTLGTVTVSAAKGDAFPVSWTVPTGKQIAVRVANTSSNNPKNVVVGLQLVGTYT